MWISEGGDHEGLCPPWAGRTVATDQRSGPRAPAPDPAGRSGPHPLAARTTPPVDENARRLGDDACYRLDRATPANPSPQCAPRTDPGAMPGSHLPLCKPRAPAEPWTGPPAQIRVRLSIAHGSRPTASLQSLEILVKLNVDATTLNDNRSCFCAASHSIN